MNRKGIILAGGYGTRLYPLTHSISKQLLPVFNKPMIYYPLSILILSGIKEILIICTPDQIKLFKKLLGSGKKLGIRFFYKIQKKPKGIAEALVIGEKFLKGKDICLILGDNIFFGKNIRNIFSKICKSKKQKIILKKVKNPNEYGVLEFKKKEPHRIIEKPKNYISNYAVTGIYFYHNHAVNIAKKLKPSNRHELEITDLNRIFIKEKKLEVFKLSEKDFWFDAGNHEEYLKTSIKVREYENFNKKIVGSIELESLRVGNISRKFYLKNFDIKNKYYQQVLEEYENS